MNTDNLILRETDNLPLINKDDTLTNAEIDGNFINIYNDFISLSQSNDLTLEYDVDRSYLVDEFATYNGRLWIATDVSTGVTPIEGSSEWNDVFPTVLAHEKNKDTILDEGGTNETTVAEIRAFIDAGLTSTTNLSLSTKTGTSFKIESSTGADVTIPQATNIEAGLLNSEDKVKLDNTSGINTGDQTLESLNAEDITNKVTDFTTINDVLYPTTQAVDTYLTAQIPSLVETFIDGNVELNTNKATTFAVINDTLYPSVKAVDDQLDLKVDKVVGSRLITSAEGAKLDNTSGTNTGDQTLQQVTDKGSDTTNNMSTTSAIYRSSFSPSTVKSATLIGGIYTSIDGDGKIQINTNGNSVGVLKATNLTANVTLEIPNKTVGSYTIATTTDLTSKVDSNTAITGATKTKITYDSKGLVTSGADATTSDIADSLNKRYVTDANLTVIGNTSGTNTGDQDLSTYQPYTTATTGSVISFIVPQVYNSVASPSSSNITDSLTSAKIGIVQKIYHNHTVAPTFPAGWVKMGTATYTTSTLNVIFAEWVSGSRVEYWITKPS